MKRYFAAGGLILASVVYFFTQHSSGEEQHQVVPPEGVGTIASAATDTNGAPFGNPVAASDSSAAPAPTKSTSHPAASSGSSVTSQGQYKNGTYTGSVADAYYGYVQVEAVVSGGKLADVKILQYPNDRSTSRYINSQALPYLVQEAVQAQSSHVNTISGASDTSAAFRQSLSSALSQA